MLPIFKTHASIGNSLLTSSVAEEENKTSIFSFGLKDICVVEDNLSQSVGLLENAEELGVNVIFGLRVSICNDLKELEKIEENTTSKIIIFAKNRDGIKLLNKIFSYSREREEGCIDNNYLLSVFDKDLISVCFPFYDSFIYYNNFKFSFCMPPDLAKLNGPVFFLEDNCLSFDFLLRESVVKFCKKNDLKVLESKSIYYNKRSDINTLTAYKLLTNRKFGSTTLEKPNLNDFSSKEFCWESYLDANK